MIDARDRIGGNSPPEPIDPHPALAAHIGDLNELARGTLTGAVTTEEQAAQAKHLRDEALAAEKLVDKTRELEKAPHLAAGRAVDARYKPLAADATRIKNAALAALTLWLQAIADEQAQVAREAADRAAAEAEAARIAHADANPADLEAVEAVEAQLKTAKRAGIDASRAAKERAVVGGGERRGVGLRTSYTATVADPVLFARHLWADYRADYDEWLAAMAARLAGPLPVPGLTIATERRAA